jgi:hypothetical protein
LAERIITVTDNVFPLNAAKADTALPGEHIKEVKKGHPLELVEHESVRKTKEWIMKGLFAKGECSRWISPPKMLKSALLSSASNHMAANRDWRGFKTKRRVGVLYCALERADLCMRRIVAEQKLLKLNNLPIMLCRKRFQLATKADVKELIDTIDQATDDLGHKVEFLVIDTSAKLIAAHGGDEQSAKDNALVWGNLSDVRERTGVHSAIIGHLGKDKSKGERGSNATLGDADFIVTITGDAVKTAAVTDGNDVANGELFSFKARKFTFGFDEDGDEDAVHIVDPDNTVQVGKTETVELTEYQRIFYRILYDAGRDGLTQDEWYVRAEKAGITRAATRTTLFNKMRDLHLVFESMGKWKVKHAS